MRKRKIFYVQIKRCSYDTYWYKDQIGKVFSVINSPVWEQSYELTGADAYIDKSDSVRVKVNEYPESLADVMPREELVD